MIYKSLKVLLLAAALACAVQAQYPGGLPTAATLGQPTDNAQTTLTSSILSDTTVLPVQSALSFEVNNFVTICTPASLGYCQYPIEKAQVTAVDVVSHTLTVIRGIDGTTPVSHGNGSYVACRLSSTYIKRLRDEIINGAPYWGTNTSSAVHGIPGAFGGNDYGSATALVPGAVYYQPVPFGCTIQGWDMVLDTGTASIDVWKINSTSALPTLSNTITASAVPAVSSGKHVHSTTLTGWTITITAHDTLAFYLKTVSGGTTQANLVLECR